jgi:hypothetical protein
MRSPAALRSASRDNPARRLLHVKVSAVIVTFSLIQSTSIAMARFESWTKCAGDELYGHMRGTQLNGCAAGAARTDASVM